MNHNAILKRVAQLDEDLFLKLFNGSSPVWLTKSALGFSKSGNGGLYVLLALVFAWFGYEQGVHIITLTLLLGFIIERPIYFFAKKSVARIRPCDGLVKGAIVPSDKFSLPSGHSSGAFLVAIILANSFPEYLLLWFAWASTVAASRVLLGVHFPADVVLGALMGSSCGVTAILLTGYL